ncbi:MAG: SPOR domain-containing protein, partial [Sphingobacteriaceae bacterium]
GLKTQKEIAETSFVQEELTPEIEEEEETEVTTEPARSGQRVFWIITILLVVILSVISLLYPDLLNTLWQKKGNPVPKPVKVSVKDTLAKADTTALADTSQLNTDSLAISPANSSTYEIIVAAFGKRSEADQYIKQLASRGISAHALENKPKEFIKISVGTFTDGKLAQAELARIQSELSSTAWIHHIKTTKTP